MKSNDNSAVPTKFDLWGLRRPVGTRKPGVPSREELYKILKQRSIELQEQAE